MISEHHFGITIGGTHYQVIEHLLTNIRHEGTFVSLGLNHHKETENVLRKIQFSAIFNPISSRYENEKHSVGTNLSINYSYLIKIPNHQAYLHEYLGIRTAWNAHMTFYDYWDESHVYWLNSYDIGIDTRIAYTGFERSRFYIDIHLPFLSMVSRPPKRFLYKEIDPSFSWFIGHFHNDLKLATIPRHLDLNTKLSYQLFISGNLKPVVFWRFRYLRNKMDYSKEVRIINHTFGLNIWI